MPVAEMSVLMYGTAWTERMHRIADLASTAGLTLSWTPGAWNGTFWGAQRTAESQKIRVACCSFLLNLSRPGSGQAALGPDAGRSGVMNKGCCEVSYDVDDVIIT